MFCLGWQIDAGCFVRGGKKWHGMFCPGMFCPTFHLTISHWTKAHCLIWQGGQKPTSLEKIGLVFYKTVYPDQTAPFRVSHTCSVFSLA